MQEQRLYVTKRQPLLLYSQTCLKSKEYNMFEGFTQARIETGEATINVRHGGNGPALLLLHGHPQTHVMWHKIAPRLAQDFTVVVADLRGYGDSSKPPTTPDHEPYSKRAMARDMVAVMHKLGFAQFLLAGHDRGGRCAYRLALDHPECVRKLAVLDIIPTGEAFRRSNIEFGLGYWHWFFLAQPYDLPERMIGANPDNYYFDGRRQLFDPEALSEYLRCVHDPATIHAMCEDYRAGATFDFALDEADRSKKRIQCPVLALWGGRGKLDQWYDVTAIWREWADDVRGQAIDSGHYLAEEAPEETYTALHEFFADKT
jgi:haloacetate dehalogenase